MIEYRSIPGYSDKYSVTKDGNVWSGFKRRRLSPSKHSQGYLEVRLKVGSGKQCVLVHRLVALAWVLNGNPEKFKCVNHLNGVKTDNRAENLEWCDHARNNQHAHTTGLQKPSQRQREAARHTALATRRFTVSQVIEFRLKHASGATVTSLAKELHVPRTTMSAVIHGHNYKNLNQ